MIRAIKALLQRGRRRRAPEVEQPSASALLDLLNAYRGEVEDENGPETHARLRRVDHRAYRHAALALLDDARDEGRREGAATMAAHALDECACACVAHGKIACPKCLHVYGCPAHAEADPATLRPELLQDPEATARALHEELRQLQGLRDPWDVLEAQDRAARSEAARRVVTVRLRRKR